MSNLKNTFHCALLLVVTATCSQANAAEENDSFDVKLLKTKSYLLNLPTATYRDLSTTFAQLYNKTLLTTDITNSAFNDTTLYDLVAFPLLSTPTNNLQFEVFGQLYDKKNIAYSQMSHSHAMYEFYSQNKQINQKKENVAVGFGMSFDLEKDVQVKTLYSTGQIPGYGDSQLSLGVEVKY
ncbi:hypothetical protein K6Y31_08650 [Motilimonas cestriensis]|uniref:Outer membrane protein beta-barrel domain-containing protein n=1 Tax=Motilimonas cestriensis TaxID=2742685 RepID=A0ABS8W9V4_9GAMM|nr:hypothetical protein [Motilimonas cestriensis]MCE2594882.1 hypothetical protein [Motilimonas cestriensis]